MRRRPSVLTRVSSIGAGIGVVLLLAACETDDAANDAPVDDAPDDDVAADAQVDIVDNGFEPSQVEVAAGGTVTWEHTGAVGHTVTFEDGEDSGSLGGGDTYERTFDDPGDYPYACSIHPAMTGTVTVTG